MAKPKLPSHPSRHPLYSPGLLSTAQIASLDWSKLVNTPTTRDGYGITDVYTDAEVDTLLAALSIPDVLDDLSDVNAPTPADGDVLTWDSGAGEWVAAVAPGGGSGPGTGTPDYLPKWDVAGTALEDSLIQEGAGFMIVGGSTVFTRVASDPALTLERTGSGARSNYIELSATGLHSDASWHMDGDLRIEGTSEFNDTVEVGDNGDTKGQLSWTNTGNSVGGPGFTIRSLSTDELMFGTNGATRWFLPTAGDLLPWVTGTYDIGSNANKIRSLYFDGVVSQGTNLTILSNSSTTLQLGAGSTWAALSFLTGGTSRWTINSSGHLLAVADNTYDIGASGATRPRIGYFGTGIVAPSVSATNLQATTAVQVGGVTRINTTRPTWGAPLTATSRIALPAAATAAQVRDACGTLIADLRAIGILA